MNRKWMIAALFLVVMVSVLYAPQPAQTSPNTVSAPAQTMGITLGIQQPPAVNYGDEMNAVNSLTGKVHGLVLYYVDWSTMYSTFLQDQWRRQMSVSDVPVAMIAWQPTNGLASLGCDKDYGFNVAIPPDKIIQGACDTYIRNYARALKATGWRFLIKFAHEMNSSGRPYWPGHFGEPPSKFVDMWRHVVDIFRSEQVTNVEWVWGPIYQSSPNDASNDLHLFYPGDNYVDWVGPMGYNYYNQLIGSPQPWLPFTNIFDSILKDFACRYPKPQIIHEFASVEGDGATLSKAAWIADAYQQAPNYPFLRAMIWYNDLDASNPSADFRITTHTGSSNPPPPTIVNPLPSNSGVWTNAYKNAIASSIYTKYLPSLAQATPPGTYCGTGATSMSVSPSSIFLVPGGSATIGFQGWLYSSPLSLSVSAPSSMSSAITPTTLQPPWGMATIRLSASTSTPLGSYQVKLHTGVADVPIHVQVVSQVFSSNIPLLLR
ncbi:MAG: hypothetical protein M1132_05095 [Chloroflexi bacterium]|nr:hypothetical protein [Chloroflexota bacterium]